eukprot:scaffold73631_cov43-Tisochrysis_lutea.AAC.1
MDAQRLLADVPTEVLIVRARTERKLGTVDNVRRTVALAQDLDLIRQSPPVHLRDVPPVDIAERFLWRRRVTGAFFGGGQAAEGGLELGVDRRRAPIRAARLARPSTLSNGARLPRIIASPLGPEARGGEASVGDRHDVRGAWLNLYILLEERQAVCESRHPERILLAAIDQAEPLTIPLPLTGAEALSRVCSGGAAADDTDGRDHRERRRAA